MIGRVRDHNTIERVARKDDRVVRDSSRDFGLFRSAIETLAFVYVLCVLVLLIAIREAGLPCLRCLVTYILTSSAYFRSMLRDFDYSRVYRRV